jgi:hypothetical protein
MGMKKKNVSWYRTLLAAALVPASGYAIQVPNSGCPMAHCTAQESDAANAVVPTGTGFGRVLDTSANASGAGLGCSSNLSIAACSFKNGDPSTHPNLIVFDGDGTPLFSAPTSGVGVLGSNAVASAPLILDDNSVLDADQSSIVLYQSGYPNNVKWIGKKTDAGVPVSATLIGDRIALIATGCVLLRPKSCGISTWDITTNTGSVAQAPLAFKALVDPITKVQYTTKNSPAVSSVVHANDGSGLARVYVLAAAGNGTSSADGRLQAVDVDLGTGAISLAWHYDVPGPGGATPLVVGNRIFFDGRATVTDAQGVTAKVGYLFAVDDLGDSYSIPDGWMQYAVNGAPAGRPFTGGWIYANAAQDPRNGLWTFANGVTYQSRGTSCGKALQTTPDNPLNCLVRLDPDDGHTLQTIDLGALIGSTRAYAVGSAVTVAQSSSGDPVLLLDTNSSRLVDPTYVLAVDVAPASGQLLWNTMVAPSRRQNSAAGQFPLVVSPGGRSRVVFGGQNYGPYIVGDQDDSGSPSSLQKKSAGTAHSTERGARRVSLDSSALHRGYAAAAMRPSSPSPSSHRSGS